MYSEEGLVELGWLASTIVPRSAVTESELSLLLSSSLLVLSEELDEVPR